MNAQLALDFTPPRSRRRPERPYYPTTPLTLDEELGAMRVAKSQNEAVLAIFRAAGRALSPSQVHARGIALGRLWLPTSVRRSITNLANEGVAVLVHLKGQYVAGPHGRPEGLWCLRGLEGAR